LFLLTLIFSNPYVLGSFVLFPHFASLIRLNRLLGMTSRKLIRISEGLLYFETLAVPDYAASLPREQSSRRLTRPGFDFRRNQLFFFTSQRSAGSEAHPVSHPNATGGGGVLFCSVTNRPWLEADRCPSFLSGQMAGCHLKLAKPARPILGC
jgi:hypothetical protein